MNLRDFTPEDSSAVRDLNDSEIPNVTAFAPGELERLAGQAIYCRVVESGGKIVAFFLALDETATYASLNFQWFKARYARFVYVDRIVVSAATQGQGIGRLLYTDLLAQITGRAPLLTCEVNIRPANPRSMRFHQKLGFREVGTQETEGGKKTVSLMVKELPEAQ